MSAGFLLLTLCVLALAIGLASLLSGALLLAGRRRLAGRAPAARARLLFAAALVPGFAGAALAAALFADIALLDSPLHCGERFAASGPAGPALALLLAWLAGSALGLARAALSAALALGARRRVRLLSEPDPRGFRTLRSGEAHAFVLGFLRPQVYVSSGLLRRADPRSLETVLAHERAHVRRREPLRRLIASVALALHLPGISDALGRALRAAEEASADAEAARALGDRARVAEALVRFARMRLAGPLAAGFEGDALEARVLEVLAPAAHPDRPRALQLLAASATVLALALAAAPLLHRASELVFELAAGS